MSIDRLTKAALEVRQRSYSPYSKFAVGAAVSTKSGRIFAGCNVENVSLGLTTCAERAAVAMAVAEGEVGLVALAVVADSEEPVVPCGACRQILAEFNPALEIVSSTLDGQTQTFLLSDLLPRPTQGILESFRNV